MSVPNVTKEPPLRLTRFDSKTMVSPLNKLLFQLGADDATSSLHRCAHQTSVFLRASSELTGCLHARTSRSIKVHAAFGARAPASDYMSLVTEQMFMTESQLDEK